LGVSGNTLSLGPQIGALARCDQHSEVRLIGRRRPNRCRPLIAIALPTSLRFAFKTSKGLKGSPGCAMGRLLVCAAFTYPAVHFVAIKPIVSAVDGTCRRTALEINKSHTAT